MPNAFMILFDHEKLDVYQLELAFISCLDALVAKRVCSAERLVPGKQMLARIVGMLTKLVQMYTDDARLKEDPPEYQTSEQSSV